MKRIISIVSIVCLLVCTTALPCFADASTNLLLGGTATANSVYNTTAAYAAGNAIDGVTTGTAAYWRSASTSSSSYVFMLDVAMASAITFDKIDIKMVSEFFWNKWSTGSSIVVTTADNASFTGAVTVATIDCSAVQDYSKTFASVTAQYIRFSFVGSTVGRAAGILEVGAYYTGEGSGDVVTNLASGKTVSTSTINSTAWSGEKTIDGVTTTGWQTASGDTAPTLTVDLGEAVAFNEWSYTTMLSVGTTNCVNSFVLEAADDAAFTQNVKTLYTGSAITNNTNGVIGFENVTARYFRFRVISRDMGNSFRIYEMAIYNAPVSSVAVSETTPVVYIPYSGSVSQKANGISAYDKNGVKIGNNAEAVYTLDTTPTGISIDAATGYITVAAGAETGTIGVNAAFTDAAFGTLEYNVTVSNTFDSSIASNPAYIVPEPVFYDAEGTAASIATAASGELKVMPIASDVPQSLYIIAVSYTDSSKTRVASIRYAGTKTLTPFEYSTVSFNVTSADENKLSIFVWDSLGSISPVMTAITK